MIEPLYEGKAKRLFRTEDPGVLRMEYKDDATAFNAQKKSSFAGKGPLNKKITALLYRELERRGVPTHLVGEDGEKTLLVRAVEILQVEVIVRNVAAGSFLKRTGFEEGRVFQTPIIEFSYKSDELGDPLINDDYIREMGLASVEELAELRRMALEINELLVAFFAQAGLRLIDFKIEFGRLEESGKVVLADEISPDTCRLWDVKTGEKLDKDRFRQDLGDLMEGYEEVLRRLEKGGEEL